MVQPPRTLSALIEYPETDGQPMTESDATRNYMVYCLAALQLFFQDQPLVYASGNLFIYYEEGQANKNISPDVFVIFGVKNRERRSYKSWQETGKLPSFVLELTSKSTKKQDEEMKPKLYERLGIEEYFQYDPTGDYLQPQLKGQMLVNGEYQPISTQVLSDGTVSVPSRVLGLELRLLPEAMSSFLSSPVGSLTRALRFFDPATGNQLMTYGELEQARKDSEQELADLRERLRQRGIDPDAL